MRETMDKVRGCISLLHQSINSQCGKENSIAARWIKFFGYVPKFYLFFESLKKSHWQICWTDVKGICNSITKNTTRYLHIFSSSENSDVSKNRKFCNNKQMVSTSATVRMNCALTCYTFPSGVPTIRQYKKKCQTNHLANLSFTNDTRSLIL